MPKITFKKAYPYLLIIAGFIGLAMAFIIMQEKIALLKNPNYVPSCNLNPVISCGSIMSSPESVAFGFPNPFLGLVGFPIVMTRGMALLAGAKFKKWFWRTFHIATFLALIFVHWLFLESVYEIQALCPYCIVVWAMTIAIFLYTTLYMLREGNIKLPKVSKFLQANHIGVLIAWYGIITALILNHFWYYFGS